MSITQEDRPRHRFSRRLNGPATFTESELKMDWNFVIF